MHRHDGSQPSMPGATSPGIRTRTAPPGRPADVAGRPSSNRKTATLTPPEPHASRRPTPARHAARHHSRQSDRHHPHTRWNSATTPPTAHGNDGRPSLPTRTTPCRTHQACARQRTCTGHPHRHATRADDAPKPHAGSHARPRLRHRQARQTRPLSRRRRPA